MSAYIKDALRPGWLLTTAEKRKPLTQEQAIEVLEDFAGEDWHGQKAAVLSLKLVREQNADARLLALLLMRAMDGAFNPNGNTKARK